MLYINKERINMTSKNQDSYNDFMQKAKNALYGETTKKQKEQQQTRNLLLNELGDKLTSV